MQIFPPSTPSVVPAVMNRQPRLCKPVFWSELQIHRVDLGPELIGLCFPETCWLGARTTLQFSPGEMGRMVPLREHREWSHIAAFLYKNIFLVFVFGRLNNPLNHNNYVYIIYYLKWLKLKLMVVESCNDRTHWSSPVRRLKFLEGSQKMQSMNSCSVYPLGIQWMLTVLNEQIHWESITNLGCKKCTYMFYTIVASVFYG